MGVQEMERLDRAIRAGQDEAYEEEYFGRKPEDEPEAVMCKGPDGAERLKRLKRRMEDKKEESE